MRRCIALVAAALGACAHVPPATDDGLDFEARRERLERVTTWEMRGRLTVDAGGEARLARFRWVQDEDTLLLNVGSRFFGAGGFEVEGTPPVLTVTTARGESRRLYDAESELSAWFGWWLPVTSLEAWLLGMPDPAFPTSNVTSRGDVLASIEQRLWSVRFGEYMLASGLLVPREIELRHRDLAVDLTVDEWNPGARAALGSLNRSIRGAHNTSVHSRARRTSRSARGLVGQAQMGRSQAVRQRVLIP